MKCSNLKSKMRRFTYSACALFFAGGLFVSCEDELLTGTPSWLGSSIYEELEKRGNETMLRLINDEDVSPVGTDGQTDYARTLSLTGSRTLFAANDSAFVRFFKNNAWGVRSYEELSPSQKKMLLNSATVNSAYLIELMSSNASTGSTDPTPGTVMRRASLLSLYDTVPLLKAADMPDNEYWSYYRSKYANGGMAVFRDNNTAPMVHFLPAYMANKMITDDDLAFLTNGACRSTAESYINGQRLTERDITCQNGYIQVVENVMAPLTNMAEVIRNDPELSTFSKMLDRFAVPRADNGLTNTLRGNNTIGEGDTAFVWRYLNNGFETNEAVNNTLLEYPENITHNTNEVLSYDPGWNTYANGSGGTPMEEDMAVIIAPTDDAFKRYFEGGGKALIDRYREVDSIPNHIIVNMLDNFMKYSLVATVPSKFSSVMNSAQLEMGLTVGEPGGTTGIGSCLMANNGVVYKSNEVYNIPEYQSVSFPASLDDNIRIMRHFIEWVDYQAYLNSMESEFMFILPTDEALKNYVDPVDYCKPQATITEFYYDDSPSAGDNPTGNPPVLNRIKCRRYNATRNPDGTLTRGEEITNPFGGTGSYSHSSMSDYVQNRLKDVLENSIIVRDKSVTTTENKSVWVTKGGCPVILEGGGNNIRITIPYRKEIADQEGGTPREMKVREKEGYYNMGNNPNGNGQTFIVDDEPVMTASKSVPTLLKELAEKNEAYREFSEMVEHNDSLVSELYNIMGSGSSSTTQSPRAISNGTTFNIMENYNYTVYVPPTSEIQKLYDNDLLPDWRDVEALNEEIDGMQDEVEILKAEARRDSMYKLINNFIRYHIQNSAVYMSAPATSGSYETSYINGGRFSTLTVTTNGGEGAGSITLVCNDNNKTAIPGEAARKVTDGNYFAREYRFRAGMSTDDSGTNVRVCATIDEATRIFNSSMVVVHLIDKPLLYSKALSDAYNRISGN